MKFFDAASRRTVLPTRRALLAAALLLLAGCGGMGEAMTAHTNVVARAAGKELRVDEAAEMLAANTQIPPDPQVVRALADLWVDYALLANAVAEDTTLAALDIASFIEPAREQALVGRLRDRVVRPDTLFDDAELQRRWATEGPSAEIRARHILLRIPTDASQAQRDSVRQQAESLASRARGGESFAQLAEQFSQDPGSAARGGDLGFFSRGRMVQPFEEVAFELQEGEVSPAVESPFGYHVILLEERRQPALGEEREEFRQYLVQRSIQDAEMAYLEQLSTQANVQVLPAGVEVVREIANRPDQTLRGRQADRNIATYDGGEYTAGEFSRFIRTQPPQMQSAFATASPDQLEQAVQQLVQMELLLSQAQAQGVTLTAAEEEEIRTEARRMIDELIEATGFAEAARQGADPASLDAYVKGLVQGIVTGEAPFVPLGRLGITLRDRYPNEINEGAFAQVVQRLEEIRARQPAPMQLPPDFDPGLQLPTEPGQQPGQAPLPGAPPAIPEDPQD